ncbi:exonuclease SbcC [Streptosporangium becharense]|uniref:Nuclease SbcCD subunit C n=1 Tax=Streptosporangium becharense TaxID=1816182 RepID=A0A7W9IM77_9ACTN|nr:AAA family ATPase [Streptosporangium becharense]MBB2911573.1 exonuclease SbcC [Streptosporangium becharense]MBB5822609.1 exonuclease SbcC [Streptosporangium becharense]
MRPHKLWISAFGSFPGEEEVDFDALTEAGLFLIHGPTGAGKTTVLDALCYALYGRVPGKRDSAKSLRCDHAPPGRGPRVALDVTIRGRRLKITRSPAWQRPKLRGTGTTRENEKALVQELTPSGEWTGLTTRVDEAGELVGTLLGMNADQFFQVAMLPQGDFARFLRADGEDRRKVLERLFSVRIYAAAESWLADRRTEAYREQQALRKEVDFVTKRIEEAAGPALLAVLAGPPQQAGGAGALLVEAGAVCGPETAPVAPPAPLSAEDDPPQWARALQELAGAAAERLGRECVRGETAVARAREELEYGTALADRRRRHAEALARRRALEETAEERADLKAVLAEAAAADRVLPLIQESEQRAEAAAKARRLAADAVARALPLLGAGGDTAAETRLTAHDGEDGKHGRDHGNDRGDDRGGVVPERLAALERDRRSEITRLRELRAEEARLTEIVRERERVLREITELSAAQAAADARLEVVPGLRHDVERRLTAARLDAARIPAAEAAVEAALTRLRAAEQRDRLAADLAAARAALAAALSVLPAADREALPADREALPADREALTSGDHDPLPAGREALTSGDGGAASAGRGTPPSDGGDTQPYGGDGAETVPYRAVDGIRATLDRWERERREELAGLEGLRADEIRLAELDGSAAALDAEIAEAARQEAFLRGVREELPAASAEATARLAGVRAHAAGIPAARAGVEAATAVLGAARRRDGLRAELEDARAAHAEAVDHAQTLRDRHQDVRQARIDGMAAELAAKLVAGHPCTVCGSPEHPAPAAPADRAPTADDERAAQGAYEAAVERRQAAGTAVTALTSRLEEAVAVAGDLAVERAAEILAAAERELAALTAEAAAEEGLAAEVDRIAAELDAARTRATEVARVLAECRARQAARRAEHERISARLDGARGADPTVRARRDRLAGEVARLSAALAAVTRVAEAEAAHREACERTGLAVRVAADELATAERALAGLRESAGAEETLAAEAAAITAELTRLQERSRELAVGLAARRTTVEGLTADAGRLAARVDEARGDAPTLAARLDRLTDEAELFREAVEAVRGEQATETEAAAARDRALAAVAEAGFLDLDDARSALRSPVEREEKSARLLALDKEEAAVAAALADPELVAAVAEPEPELAALREARDAAETAHAALLSERNQAEARLARLAALRTELETCLERWTPAADRHRLADRLAALTGGNSTDNRWSMRLSSYVLGERLRQVVDSANERLDHMSGGRYLLEHNRNRSAGDRSKSGGGLGLHVLDSWTGLGRDPATLSGGESFITSLALALGLADVVTAEAGGVELGTLFVDEGFGTLDEDTLDGVLDILDGLRDGGRAVGIVSHVAELRTRVPARLQIRKERRGSTIRQ